MEQSVDYYSILGISKNASIEDIKKARNQMALKWHPDRNKENIEQATEKMKEINMAYEILSRQKASRTIYNTIYNSRFYTTARKYQKKPLYNFKERVRETFLNSKTKMVNLKKTTKLLTPFYSFVLIITEIKKLIDDLSDPNCKLHIKILLDEIDILINDTNNIIWFKQFRNDNGLQLFYDLYLRYDYFNKYTKLRSLWHKILKYGNNFKYV